MLSYSAALPVGILNSVRCLDFLIAFGLLVISDSTNTSNRIYVYLNLLAEELRGVSIYIGGGLCKES